MKGKTRGIPWEGGRGPAELPPSSRPAGLAGRHCTSSAQAHLSNGAPPPLILSPAVRHSLHSQHSTHLCRLHSALPHPLRLTTRPALALAGLNRPEQAALDCCHAKEDKTNLPACGHARRAQPVCHLFAACCMQEMGSPRRDNPTPAGGALTHCE